MTLKLESWQQKQRVTPTLENETLEKLVSAAVESSEKNTTLDTFTNLAITQGFAMMKITSTPKACTATNTKEETQMITAEILSKNRY